MKDITLKITGKQFTEEGLKDSIEFMTEGKLYDKGNVVYLLYDETELSGMPGCHTRLRLEGTKIRMTRKDDSGLNTEMEFEKGKRYHGFYDTPYGAIELEVMANDVVNSLKQDGTGSVDIDYHIALKGLLEGRNMLNITIM